MTYDPYMSSMGFQPGTYAPNSFGTAYAAPTQPQQQAPVWAIATQPRQEPQQTQSSGGGMNMAAGIGKNFMGGGNASGGSNASGFGGGNWGGAVTGAMAGLAAGQYNYETDPVMQSGKDGFGEHYPDYRAQVGGAMLGGVMGYYGLGGFAGPAVMAAHPVMEPATRAVINWGDSWGGAGAAFHLDPFGTVASGKYSGEELAIGAAMGPAADWLGII